jgi:SAM-dependent methyltransferase
MDESVRAFYDELAEDYRLIYADWRGSMRRQAAALDRVLREALGPGPLAVLDAACGIGTQALGLAELGYRVHATDLSPAAVARAEREANALGVVATFGVADLRSLEHDVDGVFDVVLACDNALPHLLTDADLRRAVASMAAKIRPGGLFLASLRDYDRLIEERPRSEGPRIFDDAGRRRLAFQVWDWQEEGGRYTLHQFITRQAGVSWQTTHAVTEYRALLRAELEAALGEAGLRDVRWQEPEASGFFQPLVTARKP